MKSFEEHWQDYCTAIYPGGLSGIQAQETKQAFMAGAISTLKQLDHAGMMPEEDALRAVNAMHNEALTYAEKRLAALYFKGN